MNTINICFGIDNNFTKYMLVTITSIFENKTNNKKIHIFIIHNGLSKKNKELIKKHSKKHKYKLTLKKIENKKYFKRNKHLSVAAYNRIMIPNLFPKINKIIYLDSDLIVLKDLEPLWNIKLNKNIIGAVENPTHTIYKEINLTKHQSLNMPLKYLYFNSGVLLINCKKYRKLNILQKLIKYIIKNPHKLELSDQDALNAILYNYTKIIDLKYNFVWHFYFITNISKYYNIAKIKNIINEKPVIYHYIGPIKPWHYEYYGPFLKEYKQYYYKTYNQPLKITKKIFKKIKNILIMNIRNNYQLYTLLKKSGLLRIYHKIKS